ncbi:family 1 glycosylhydrolase [Diaminobutyricibacter sp. McL0618]|uniref:family 1 glycosylhydrolase n=1 Tax=Leifsonia sp. McL0618 TaxID=3415677 RepID=UPI003CF1FBFD
MTEHPRHEPGAAFIWALGIEDTNVGWPLPGSPNGLDEYELTGHYRQWQQDLMLAVSVGASAIRYGFPWYRVESSPGVFDWTWTDQVVAEAERIGLDLIVDLVHYGTPTWLEGSFTDPRYPDAVATWAEAVASRYRGRFSSITPLNEPLVTASFVGLRGIWPPHETGQSGWARVVVSVAEGIQRSIAAIRRVAPEMDVVHVEATHVWTIAGQALEDEHRLLEAKNWLPTDLVLGRVDHSHPLHGWLVERGIDIERLSHLVAAGEVPDVIGLNYYPELSARELNTVGGDVVGVTFDAGGAGLEVLIRAFHERYGLPILVSETAVEGDDDHRIRWLDVAVALIARLRTEGVPIVGLVWWPLFDFVDWSWATGDLVIEEFHTLVDGVITPVIPPARGERIDAYFRRMGLFRLSTEGFDIARLRTAAADAFLRHTATALPYTTIGGTE